MLSLAQRGVPFRHIRRFHIRAQPAPSITSRYRAMSSLNVVVSPDAPAAIGPYSQAIKANGFVFLSGCIPMDPATKDIVPGSVVEQTKQALANLKAVVEASGSSIDRIVKTTVFIKDMNEFGVINGVYTEFFGDHKPARSLVEVARLPKDVLFEIEAVAVAA